MWPSLFGFIEIEMLLLIEEKDAGILNYTNAIVIFLQIIVVGLMDIGHWFPLQLYFWLHIISQVFSQVSRGFSYIS